MQLKLKNAAQLDQVTHCKDVKVTYQIQRPHPQIASCLKLRPKTIGSSFSIWIGILYCIKSF